MSGSTTLDIVYAIDPMPKHDPILEAAEEGVECLSEIINAGSYLVDSVPIRKHRVSYFPVPPVYLTPLLQSSTCPCGSPVLSSSARLPAGRRRSMPFTCAPTR